jgi:hypothetical protein
VQPSLDFLLWWSLTAEASRAAASCRNPEHPRRGCPACDRWLKLDALAQRAALDLSEDDRPAVEAVTEFRYKLP